MDEAKCPQCGAEGALAETCSSCSVPLEAKCPNCGNAESKCECVKEDQH